MKFQGIVSLGSTKEVEGKAVSTGASHAPGLDNAWFFMTSSRKKLILVHCACKPPFISFSNELILSFCTCIVLKIILFTSHYLFVFCV